jgi:hypothetical protein
MKAYVYRDSLVSASLAFLYYTADPEVLQKALSMDPKYMNTLLACAFHPFTSLHLKFELLRFVFLGTLYSEACREVIDMNYVRMITDCCDVTSYGQWPCMSLPSEYNQNGLIKVLVFMF